MEETMLCKYCGSEIKDDCVFCYECGKRLVGGESAGQEAAETGAGCRETITKKARAEYIHIKQTEKSGQYAKVVLEIAPLPRGEQFKFTNAISGGVISERYIPGVVKGIQEAMAHGTVAGCPVVDVECKIVDGKEHPVDSSELSFKLAARNAFLKAMKQAGPIVLEPDAAGGGQEPRAGR
jgi:translation elongation factor EF-G